ncbi:putative CDK2-ASSOCIATED DUAL SPECIFICITY PHOSPHATASE (KINASE ASSOCIATED PHOSPHATASE) [Vibrio nigripulchritudo SFn27]|uniref:Putative CDK2-ASSOCIATED DUAL SPECIFICITY PHOSPHATASE (KINASE ASSOCIATED PHOSPHATASE) n=1 Tax=Vibrio nigripulchritudo TaxID=28173 RepID=U4K380_9VIBR|nr:cyclin-dependent kinase inhibitor 3 family protein [Vibrio nigripulchritudo]CCN80424.1 putative CDK2-ASSOCIATED DUAL SPECIFICITY PHOSPHATASE (KINASE ASSOCIATED PHOSPHATASE) [Vibrio nigripulchritudo BLFn1]CCN88411.1 putative CDK2-ASSOCIATED DUAL SPECIFICITY PHOSPHATASE (KINASE ASSOCIATED PHOSPHATASE) [Vibrio nigripulchritudo SFn27]CCN92567.1 putative CDK2-ASSOCIATED DUAL SPECIFICITY PHOSPHATASE (KINASE ASSOCIATED PHOSPHATASE) [Vibrio nigripulchritudo ENn2]CCO40954.1 putative CDK2-ASSOCIATED D
MTHPTWNLALESGGLVLTPCPGTKGVALEASLQQLKDEGVQAVVTALDNAELASKAVSDLGEITEKLGMKWFQIEIEDDCAPSDAFTAKWQKASPELHKILSQGGKVALHCMGGSGRTGLFAAHLLLEKGWELADIIREVQALRPGAFTKPVQVDYIERVAG